MAVGFLVKTVVFDRDLYKPGHMVHRWVGLVTTHFVMHAKERAPKRTGRLANGISGDTNQVGPRQVEGLIESTAPYTMFVLRGTTGPIMTTAGWASGGEPYTYLWGSIDPKTGKFTRRRIPGVRRKRHRIPKKGHWMRIPPSPEGSKPFYASQVAGQAPNNFLMGAWRATQHNHRAIRGRVPSWIRDL